MRDICILGEERTVALVSVVAAATVFVLIFNS